MRTARTRPVRTPFMPKKAVPAMPTVSFGSYALAYAELNSLVQNLKDIQVELERKAGSADAVIDKVRDKITAADREIAKLVKVRDGIRYVRGEDGKDADNELIANLIYSRLPKPKDGKDAEVDYAKIMREVRKIIRDGKDAKVDYELIIKKLRQELKVEDIPGLKIELDNFSRQVAGKVYGKDTWARGGGDTVIAGENVVITTNVNGQKVINASGGGSGTNVTTQYSLTAVQAGDNVTIDLSQLTNFATFVDLIALYRNNTMQTETLNFSIVGDIVTILAADAAEIFNITYSYS